MLNEQEELYRLLQDLNIPAITSDITKDENLDYINNFIKKKYKVRIITRPSKENLGKWFYLVSDDNIDSLVSEDFNDYESEHKAKLIGVIEGLSYIHLYLAENCLIKLKK